MHPEFKPAVKTANQVIVYQRSRLDKKEIQIKLLNDVRAKRGWWTFTFCSHAASDTLRYVSDQLVSHSERRLSS